MTTITHEARNFSHGGKLYAYTGVNTDGGVICAGCGKGLKNFKGLMSHQNSRNVAMGCKPVFEDKFAVTEREAAEEAAEPIETGLGAHLDKEVPLEPIRYFLDGVEVTGTEAAAEQAAIDAEPYSDAKLEAAIGEHFEECAAATATLTDEDIAKAEAETEALYREQEARTGVYVPVDDTPDFVNGEPIEVRDWVIANARRYARRAEGRRDTLVHLITDKEFGTPTAWRWHPEDAANLARTAASSDVVKTTKHDEGRKGETVITEYSWLDGVRARVTEKFDV